MVTFPLIVYGNGTMYREVFNAIAATMFSGGYHYLIVLMLAVSTVLTVMLFTATRSLNVFIKWLCAYVIIFCVLFLPARVEVIDKINHRAYSVDHVPLVLAIVTSYTSRIGAGLTALVDKVFTLPGDLGYEHSGLIMASKVALASTQFQVTDPSFNRNLQSYVRQCVFYDLLLHRYSTQDLLDSNDIWQLLVDHASPARSFRYDAQIITCQSGAQKLSRGWHAAIQQAAGFYGARMYPDATNPKATLLGYLPDSYNYLSMQKIATNASTLMQQNMMANAIQTGFAANAEDYAFTKAQINKRYTNETIGDMAAYWLPIMQNTFTIFAYGIFIFVFLLLMIPNTGMSALKNYVASLFFLQMWAPLYAILNMIMNFYAVHSNVGALGLANGTLGLTLSNQNNLAQVNADIANVAGYLSLSVPLAAWGITKGMGQILPQIAQYISGVTQSAASSAASEVASGNESLGNVNYQTTSAHNSSIDHFDMNGRATSGMFTTQMPGGSTMSVAPDGNLIMNNQGAISNLGVHANIADSLRSAYSQQADKSYSAGITQAKSYGSAVSSAMRDMYELSDTHASNDTSGHSWSYSNNASFNQAVAANQRLTQRFADDHGCSYSEAANVLTDVYTNDTVSAHAGVNSPFGGASINTSMGGRHDASVAHNQYDNHLYQQAKDYVNDTNYAQNADTALRVSQEQSLRTSNDHSQRLLDNMGSAMDQAQTARNDMTSSFTAAASYREQASLTQENAVNINANADQVTLQALEAQGISQSHIEQLMTEHPAQGQQAVQTAVARYADSIVGGWSHELPNSENAIKSNYQNDSDQIKDTNQIQVKNDQAKEKVTDAAATEQLTKKDFIDGSAKQLTAEELAKAHTKIIDGKTQTTDKGANLKTHTLKKQRNIKGKK